MTAAAVEAAPLTLPDRWDLGADPARVAAAAAGWRALGTALTRVRAEVGLRVAGLRSREGWTGPAADAYWGHAVRADALLQDQAAATDAVAGHLDYAAELLRWAQGSLDAGLDWLGSVAVVSRPGPGQVRVDLPPGDPERALFALRMAAAQADQVRADLDAQLAVVAAALTVVAAQLERTAARAGAERAKVRGELPDLLPAAPARAAGAGPAVVDGTHVTVGGTAGDDAITVARTPAGLAVTVNGDRTVYAPGTVLTVAGGGGADGVVLERNVGDAAVTVLGGDGYDEIRSHQPGQGGTITAAPGTRFLVGGDGDDALEGGAGNDRLSGGDGQDYLDGFRGRDVLDGGAGHDVQYGGSGRDLLRGGTGQDYQDGGTGADDLVGGGGDDILSGGRGDDRLRSGAGNDVLYAGAGRDRLTGGSGRDRGYLQPGEDTADVDRARAVRIDPEAGDGIKVGGTPEFKERVGADLDTLRSSPTGLAMLHSLDDEPTGRRTLVVAVPVPIIRGPILAPPTDAADPDAGTHAGPGAGPVVARRGPSGGAGPQPDVVISELPGSEEDNGYAYATIPPGIGYQAQPYGRRPPIGVLFHEMAHMYDYIHRTVEPGTYAGDDEADSGDIRRLERQAVGLPIDDESDPGGAEAIDPEHRLTYTENGLRAEMGMEPRRHYDGPSPI